MENRHYAEKRNSGAGRPGHGAGKPGYGAGRNAAGSVKKTAEAFLDYFRTEIGDVE